MPEAHSTLAKPPGTQTPGAGAAPPRLVLSANAAPGLGGQGLNLQHMIQCFSREYDQRVFAAGMGLEWEGKEAERIATVSPSALGGWVAKTPLLRRRRDWITWLSERNHDSKVAARLAQDEAPQYFQGASGQCLDSLRLARSKGSHTILDVLTLHHEDYMRAAESEAAKFGVQSHGHPGIAKQIAREYAEADIIRVMSGPARDTFLARGFDSRRVFAAAPPVEIPEIDSGRKEPDPFVISYVGLLEPAKGFHQLIEAFEKLSSRDAQLWLWGNTGSREMSRYLAARMQACPRIQLKPFSVRQLGHEKVYGASSVLVHPSLADGFGYVVSEAMASGIPVITTTATGASEWVREGVNGYVLAPGDVEGIRDRLEQLMQSPSRRREMGLAARESMRHLTLERMRACYREAFERNGIGVSSGRSR
jgi:glycosyltransferase involved in cell wall biosynthesis